MEIQDLLSVHVCSTAKNVCGVSCHNCVGASCYSCDNARVARTGGSASKLCADND